MSYQPTGEALPSIFETAIWQQSATLFVSSSLAPAWPADDMDFAFVRNFLFADGRSDTDQRVLPPRFASGFTLFCYGLEFALASVARTDFAQVFETVNSGRMAIRKFYLDCVVPHCCGALSRYPGLKHG